MSSGADTPNQIAVLEATIMQLESEIAQLEERLKMAEEALNAASANEKMLLARVREMMVNGWIEK